MALSEAAWYEDTSELLGADSVDVSDSSGGRGWTAESFADDLSPSDVGSILDSASALHELEHWKEVVAEAVEGIVLANGLTLESSVEDVFAVEGLSAELEAACMLAAAREQMSLVEREGAPTSATSADRESGTTPCAS